MGRGNPRAFEGVRESTQFIPGGKEALSEKIDVRVTPQMKQKLKLLPNWQQKLREAIADLIELHESID